MKAGAAKKRIYAPKVAKASVMKLVHQVNLMVEQSGEAAGFDAAEWVERWLDEPIPALGGKRPREYMNSLEGQERILMLLAQTQSGTYA